MSFGGGIQAFFLTGGFTVKVDPGNSIVDFWRPLDGDVDVDRQPTAIAGFGDNRRATDAEPYFHLYDADGFEVEGDKRVVDYEVRFAPDAPLSPGTKHYMVVDTGVPLGGGDVTEWLEVAEFTTGERPAVADFDPYADGVPLDSVVRVVFDLPAPEATLKMVYSLLDDDVPGTMAWNADWTEAVFTPEQPLRPGKNYNVLVWPAPDGPPPSYGVFAWGFSTGEGIIREHKPARDATDCARDVAIWMKFNQAVDRASVEGEFSLTPAGGSATPGSFHWANSKEATFQPSSPLEAGRIHTALLPSGVGMKDGSTTGSPYEWTFATQAFPVLSWLKADGYDSRDGVDPDLGAPDDTVFRFKVKLTDADGDEPESMQLVLYRNDARWKKVSMSAGGGSTRDGRKYATNLRLPAGDWTYRFTAKDGDGTATTAWRSGPIISSRPHLYWVGTRGYEADGVDPGSGTPDNTVFTFKVKYTDANGDLPNWLKVRTMRDGVTYKKAAMTTEDPAPDAEAGIVYEYATALPSGVYQYRFLAGDGDGGALGPARETMDGPDLGGGASGVMVAGLAASAKAAGAQVTFTLSSSASVSARVLNIAGRPVRTLCTTRDCEAGTNTLLWNATSDQGLQVPNGTYLVEVAAMAGDGSHTRALARVSLGR